MKVTAKRLWQLVLATAMLMAVSYLSFHLLTRHQDFPPPDVPGWQMLGLLLVRALMIAAVLAYATVRSRWAGTQLIVAVFVVFFGVNTFITISQAVLLAPSVMTPLWAAVLTAHGFLVALVFSFLLVLLMGRMKPEEIVVETSRLHLPAGEWLGKLAVCAAVHVVLYVLVGAVAPEPVRQFYQEVGLVPVWQRMMLDVGRALLLVAFVLPVIKMMRGGRLEAALTVAFLLCILGGVAPMLIPSQFLPGTVRLFLLAEGAVINFAFGLLVGYLLSRWPGGV